MPASADVVYKDRDTIVADLIASWQARMPDVQVTPDSVIRIWIEVAAETIEGLMLANQLLHDDMFPQTASGLALQRYGDIYGRSMKGGTQATGTVRFTGSPGTFIQSGTVVASPSTTDDAWGFLTTQGVTIPAVGTPTTPTAADAGAGALPAGLYEYAVSFTTTLGESPIGAISTGLSIAVSHNINLTAIPIGGPGTVGRKIYRRINGGTFALVTTLANNTATTFTDNVTSLGGPPLTDSTAEQVDVAAAAEDVGTDYNVLANTITVISDTGGTTGVSGVTNPAAFTGGTNPEDIEAFRRALLDYIRNPQAGSKSDLEIWAMSINGVESATAFPNDNLGTPTAGHATTRITGPGGTVPSAGVQATVLAYQQTKDLANITLHVGTFTPKTVNVTVTITLVSGYVLADVSASVQKAISDYISAAPVNGTVYLAGIMDAVFGLPGVATLVINSPATDTTSLATEKPTPGTITVS